MMIDWILENAVAFLALIVAGWSAWYTKKYSGQQTVIQRKALEIEQKRERKRTEESKKAKFDVNLVKDANSKDRRVYKQLRLTNTGDNDARNIRWTLNGVRPSKFQNILGYDSDIDLIDRIKSGTTKVFKIATDKDSDKVWSVKVEWDDKAGKNNEDEFELRL